ncbi:MAG: carboxylesterase family protein [Cellvibrionaceae bacterium]|nr:carboxylesterase family protein [Cellvibrionaceae bacterium]
MKKNTRFYRSFLLLIGFVTGSVLSACSSTQQAKAPVVKTTYGYISGAIEDGIYSFKGIPYAQAERFKPPQAPESWKALREHTRFGPIAMQVNSWSPETAMNEEKLFTVNVWTQGLNDGKKGR